MSERPSLTVITHLNAWVSILVADYRKRPKGCHHIDVRVDCHEVRRGNAPRLPATKKAENAELFKRIAVQAGGG